MRAMKHFAIALFLGITVITTTRAEIVITNPVAKDIGRSYGFYLGQKYSLKRISKDFPVLSGVALLAEKEFSAEFGDSISEMDARMLNLSPDEWKKIKADLERQIAENTASIMLNHAGAERFIKIVRDRAKGDIPSPVAETLLMFKPRYQRNPVTEFTDGYKQRHESEGSGKAKGVAFSIEVPRSWKPMEGNRPNIVAKFVSENGRGLELFLVLIKTVPQGPGETINAADIAEILNPKAMTEMLPKGAKYLSGGEFTVEMLPGYWVRFDTTAARGRQSINMSLIVYTIFYKDRMIQMHGQVAAPSGERNNSNLRFDKFEKLFDLIAQSLVLPQIYNR
jgi:hypothetical protein